MCCTLAYRLELRVPALGVKLHSFYSLTRLGLRCDGTALQNYRLLKSLTPLDPPPAAALARSALVILSDPVTFTSQLPGRILMTITDQQVGVPLASC